VASIGIDFGTSNCTAFLSHAGKVTPIPLDEGRLAMPSVVFTARREVALRQVEQLRGSAPQGASTQSDRDFSFFSMMADGNAIIFGNPALRTYFEDPLGGVLVRSPKSFLGSDIHADHLARFEEIVSGMLQHIKAMAELIHGGPVTKAVIGRPVRYHGTRGEEGNSQAMEVMARAAARAGFDDFCFELEPVAAAYEYESAITSEQKLLVVDVGGGTTDCVVMRVNPALAGKADRLADILGVSGDRIGGNDFDEALAWASVMPLFGKNTVTKDGRPQPHSLVHDAMSIRNLPAQIRFARSAEAIEECMRQSASPEKWARLLKLNQQHLQYRVVHSVERAKMDLSSAPQSPVDLAYVESGLSATVEREGLAEATERLVSKVRSLAGEAIQASQTRPDVVFLTGGMAQSPLIKEAVSGLIDATVPLRSGDMLGSVGRGLGLSAGRLFV